MEYISENLYTKVSDKCSVAVVGGGIAGIAAALAAARSGADVMLLEREFILGGLATAGLVTIYLPLCDGMGNQVSFGIAEELFRLSIKYACEDRYPKAWLEGGTKEERAKERFEVQYNPHLFAICAERLLLENGVRILYGTSVCAVSKENNKISALIIENKSGRSAISVNSVVDCTGDADIVKLSGEKSAVFAQKNVLASWYYYNCAEKYGLEMLGFCDVPDEEKNENNKVELLTNRRFSGLEALELSEMVQMSHSSMLGHILGRRKDNSSYLPVTIPSIPQIRMTRRIDGSNTMTLSGDGKPVSDSVGIISNWKVRGPVYEVPFSALHGSTVKNLITAGRCISADDAMWDVTRVIPACAVTGQAAGTAAAQGCDFQNIDVAKLQKSLEACGVVIHISEL